MNSIALPRNPISDQQHIFSEISHIKQVICRNTKTFYSDMLTVSTEIDSIYDFLSQTMLYLQKMIENPQSHPDLPEYMVKVKEDDVCFDCNPGYVTFVCKEGNMHYPLPVQILRSYPDSKLYEMYGNTETRQIGGYLYVDESESVFPYVLDYLQARPVNIDSFNDKYFEDFLSSLTKLGIPWNNDMNERHKEIINTLMMNSWTQNQIRFNINDELYIIRREDIRKYGLYKSLFNCQLDDRLNYDVTNNAFIFTHPMKYFNYVEEYVQTGEVTLKVNDVEHIEEIEEEFIYLNINNSDIWTTYTSLPLLFHDTHILNLKLIYYISSWFSSKKMWKLLYRGSQDGFSSDIFHNLCDNKEQTILFIESKCGEHIYKFGGYNSNSWSKKFKDQYDPKSYIFVLDNPYNIIPTRYFPKPNVHNILYKQLVGPIFGNNQNMDLYLGKDMDKPHNNRIEFTGNGAYEFTDISLSSHDSQILKFNNSELPLKLFSENEICTNEQGQHYVEFIVNEIEVYSY